MMLYSAFDCSPQAGSTRATRPALLLSCQPASSSTAQFHSFVLCSYLTSCGYLQVEWNPNEKTFDCPCHGSHFDRYGRVIQGPASTDLRSLDDPIPNLIGTQGDGERKTVKP